MKQFILFPFILIGMICMIIYAWWPEEKKIMKSH